ncbi:uncharacterized protein LOC112573884 isoform X3 [Pomacea canaliculata]|nr:uncharacterized protein LOC112573884 isoform X3 [Pomacea canaliculata]
MEFLLLCFSWLVTIVMITMMALALPLLLHLVLPHQASLTLTARAAYVGMLTSGEAILLHHVLTLLTGSPFASLEHFLGRVLGLFPALLMVQACACAMTFSSSCPAENTDGGETVEEGAGSLPTSHPRHPSLGRGSPREGNACHITVGAHETCQGKGEQQDFARNSRKRGGKVPGLVLPFLLSYLWTVALVMSVVFYLYPNTNSCFCETACFDNEIFLRFPVEEGVVRGLQKSMHALDDESVSEGDVGERRLSEVLTIQERHSTDEGGEPDLTLSKTRHYVIVQLLRYDQRDTVAHEGTENSWKRKKTSGIQVDVALVQASPSAKACESETPWLCVKNIQTEIFVYLCFILPLALSCLLVTWWSSGVSDHCDCKTNVLKSEVSSSATVQNHHSKDDLCNTKQLFTDRYPSMHCNCSPEQQLYYEDDIKERPLSTPPPTQAQRKTELKTGGGTSVDQQVVSSKCRVCICLSEYLLLVCNVLVLEALVCPLLWGARGWVGGGQYRLPPFDLLIIPAYSAICFVYGSAVFTSH